MISLPCRPSDLLNFDLSKIPDQGPIVWRFCLGLEDPFFPIDDPMHFESLGLALSKFTQEIWPIYQERTSGAVLYQGSADFRAHFSWTDKQLLNKDLWFEEKKGNDAHLERLFCADAFVHYFQMLAHRLPDELPIYLLLDATDTGTVAERHQLLSRERFEHFLIATKGLPHTNGYLWIDKEKIILSEKTPIALCFPEEKMCSPEVLEKLNRWMKNIQKPFRVIFESFLTEDWEGVDFLYVFKSTLSPQGARKLQGFLATGGEIFYEE